MSRLRPLARFAAPAVLVGLAAYVVADVAANVDESRRAMVALALVMAGGILLLRRTPFYGSVVVFLSASVMATVNPTESENDIGAIFVAFIFTAWWTGRFSGRRLAPVALIAVTVSAAYVNVQFDATPSDYFWVEFFMVGAWAAGFAIAERTLRAERMVARATLLESEHERLALEAVAEERRRIARELHDVIAHSVSVMTVQAGGVRRLLRDDQEREREALRTVEETGRQALAEMRRLVGLLKEDTAMPRYAPLPGLSTLDTLLGSVRDAGLPVELVVEGEPRPLPASVELAAYRVVQESLTNALRYAGQARAWVTIGWRDDGVELEVGNDGRSEGACTGGGHGLAGMRERVAVVHGTLEAGPRPGGGFLVKAFLPAGAAHA